MTKVSYFNHFQGKCESAKASEAKKTKLVTLSWEGNRNTESSEVITLPVPYELPPQRYSSEGYTALSLIKACVIFLTLTSSTFLSEQTSLGLGTGDIARKMFMAKFGQDKFNYTPLKTNNMFDFLCLKIIGVLNFLVISST